MITHYPIIHPLKPITLCILFKTKEENQITLVLLAKHQEVLVKVYEWSLAMIVLCAKLLGLCPKV